MWPFPGAGLASSRVRWETLPTPDPSRERIESRIRRWVGTRGFSFEEEIAGIAESEGFEVVLSGHYSDPVTGFEREGDIVASRTDFSMGDPIAVVSLVIECKTVQPLRPFVLFSRPATRPASQSRTAGRFATFEGRRILSGLHQYSGALKSPLLSLDLPTGYCLRQVPLDKSEADREPSRSAKGSLPEESPKGDKLDHALEAVGQVISASKAKIAAIRRAEKEHEVDTAEICFPVIVVNRDFYVVTLGAGAMQSIGKVSRGLLLYRDLTSKYSFKRIHVVAASNVREFLKEAKQSADTILRCADGAIQEALENERVLGEQ